MSERRIWFQMPDGRDDRLWKVVIGTPRSEAQLRGCVGFTDYEKRRIIIDHRKEGIGETLLHELMHAALDPHDMHQDDEHAFIERLSPRLYPMLEWAGLRWPEMPKRGRR